MAKPHGYHFGGPVLGPLAITLGLPLVCYLLSYCCNEQVRLDDARNKTHF